MKEKDILFELGDHFLIKGSKSYEVCKLAKSGTHSVVCAWIGFRVDNAFARAVAEVKRREGKG